MDYQLKLKIKGPLPFLEDFLAELKQKYIVVPTSEIRTLPGEDPFIFVTILEASN